MQIGSSIRKQRKEKNMSLEDLSNKSGVALATLSRMENGKMTGTLNSHVNICKALGISIAGLYRDLEDKSKTVDEVTKKARAEHLVHARKTKYELLVTKPLDKKIMPLMLKLESGGSTTKEKNKPGVEKFIYMITGSLEAVIGGQTYILKKGDSLYFDASLFHSFRNKTKNETEAIFIVSPPEF